MKRLLALPMLLVFALVVAACAPAAPAPAPAPAAEEAPTEAATEAPAEEAAAEAPAELQDIVDTAVGAGSFGTLVAAVQAAGLVDTLKGEGPFTVFAPTEEAFAALPAGTLESLLADPSGDLTQILLYHVVPGKVMAADVSDGLEADTAQGGKVTFAVADGMVIRPSSHPANANNDMRARQNVQDHQVAISDPPFSTRAPIATLVHPFVTTCFVGIKCRSTIDSRPRRCQSCGVRVHPDSRSSGSISIPYQDVLVRRRR